MATLSRQTLSPVPNRALVLLALCLLLPSLIVAEGKIPHVGKQARENWQQYQYASEHKAFAIAPGGAWAWQADALSASEAEHTALENCQSHTQQRCILYALNNSIVFNQKHWSSLWSPYADASQASQAETGRRVGQRFYDISWQTDTGSDSVSGLKGKIVFLHFWGSWCPPCLREFPELKTFHQALQERFGEQVAMVFLQVREPFIVSQQWAEENGFTGLPLADSGASSSDNQLLTLVDGTTIEDRKIARVFPSTYILDKHGLVLFSHYGPVADWDEYLPFIEHAVLNQQSYHADTQE